MACGKTFRSEAAWDSHERSKKHMQAVERLKREMLEEDEELGLEAEDTDGGKSDEDNEEDSNDVAEEPPQSLEPESDKVDGVSEEQEDTGHVEEEGVEGDVEGGPQMKSRKKKKAKKQSRAPSPEPLSKSARRAQARRAPSPLSSVPAELAEPSQIDRPQEPEVQSAARVESDAAEKFDISKRDKRRAREAAKKAKEEQDNNTPVVRSNSPILVWELTSRRPVMSAMRCSRAGQNYSLISIPQDMPPQGKLARASLWARRRERRESGSLTQQYMLYNSYYLPWTEHVVDILTSSHRSSLLWIAFGARA